MTTKFYPLLAIVTGGMIVALGVPTTSVARAVQLGPDRYSVTLRSADLRPATPGGAQRALSRIQRAALEACGASNFSPTVMKAAIRRSTCWRESVADAVGKLDDRLVTQAYLRTIAREKTA